MQKSTGLCEKRQSLVESLLTIILTSLTSRAENGGYGFAGDHG